MVKMPRPKEFNCCWKCRWGVIQNILTTDIPSSACAKPPYGISVPTKITSEVISCTEFEPGKAKEDWQ